MHQTFELTHTDPETFRRLTLAKAAFNGLTHQAGTVSLRSAHQ
jgi:hypothetical protein